MFVTIGLHYDAPMVRRSTSTSSFGVSKRESHDAAAFYGRFTPPDLSTDATVDAGKEIDRLVCADARSMGDVPDSSVALVVTSPPYFAGKEYEKELGEGGVPATYIEYLSMLRDVFAECTRTLEPGGRIAVNVANLGRRPYRSLSADITGILQDDLRLLLRGEIIWVKQRGSSGSCAWGSFQRPGNPVLRDLTERVIVASKGRFDRAIPPRERARLGLPSEATMTREAFMEDTLDVWEIPPESATRVGHPAPFPVELVARLIELYTYRGDLVLDPFAGSGTSAVAAVRAGRHYVGYDLDGSYIEKAAARVAGERRRLGEGPVVQPRLEVPVVSLTTVDAAVAEVTSEGKGAKEMAVVAISAAGFARTEPGRRAPGGVATDAQVWDRSGRALSVIIAGSHTNHRPGLQRGETVWRTIAAAAVIDESGFAPLVVITTGMPAPGTPSAALIGAVCGPGRPIHAVVDLLDPAGPGRLATLAAGG